MKLPNYMFSSDGYLYNDKNTVESKYTIKRYNIVNKKLRKSKSKIIAGLDFSHIAEKYDVSFTHQPFEPDVLSIDGVTLMYNSECVLRLELGEDPSKYLEMEDNHLKIDHRIGSGVWLGTHPNVIPSPWTCFFWDTEPVAMQSIDQRQGWSCIMNRSTVFRDMINDLIAENHQAMFERHHHYQYGHSKNCKHDLTRFMMRRNELQNNTSSLEYTMTNEIFVADKEQSKDKLPFFLLGPWHDTTLCELVAETSINVFFPTEKTVKPIAAGMPFVEVACCGFLKRLRKMGFRTFHPYIDESYDVIDDWQQRCQTATESFFTFVKNPNHLGKIQEICDHNQKILAKIQTHDQDHRIWKKLRRFIRF